MCVAQVPSRSGGWEASLCPLKEMKQMRCGESAGRWEAGAMGLSGKDRRQDLAS